MKFVLFILVTSLSTLAVAADSSVSISRGHDFDTDREDKTYTLSAAPFGFTGGAALGASETISAGLVLNKRNILFVEGSHESSSGTNESWLLPGADQSMTFHTDMSVWGIGLKHFVNRWLYLKTSADYIVARGDAFYSPGWFSGQNATNGNVQGSAIAGSVGIGNEWQWSTFNLGIQWVGALIPLYSNVTRDEIDPNAPVAARDDQNSLKNSLFSSVMFEFARVYVGVAF